MNKIKESNLSIKCPHCLRLTLTNFGIRIEGVANYSIYSDRSSHIHYGPSGGMRYHSHETLGSIIKSKIFIGFYCNKCDTQYPKDMEKRIFKFIKNKKFLCQLAFKSQRNY